jgi:hypothetical protein
LAEFGRGFNFLKRNGHAIFRSCFNKSMDRIAMSAISPIQIRLPDEERDALDAFRREQKNPPSRAQAAHQLILRALHPGNRTQPAEARV